jgi:hypothetical protein
MPSSFLLYSYLSSPSTLAISWPTRLSSPPAHPAAAGARPQRARGPPPPQTLARKRPSRRRPRPWGPLGSAVFPNHPSCLTPMSPSAPSLLHIALSRTEPPPPLEATRSVSIPVVSSHLFSATFLSSPFLAAPGATLARHGRSSPSVLAARGCGVLGRRGPRPRRPWRAALRSPAARPGVARGALGVARGARGSPCPGAPARHAVPTARHSARCPRRGLCGEVKQHSQIEMGKMIFQKVGIG